MVTVQQMLNKALKIDVDYLVQLSLIDSREEYIRIQREQMMQGKRSDGKYIFNLKTGSDQYSVNYAQIKGHTSPIDLRFTGEFQSQIFLLVENGTEAIVDSEDEKSGDLQERYGGEIFGLNKESKIDFIPFANTALIDEVTKELNKV